MTIEATAAAALADIREQMQTGAFAAAAASLRQILIERADDVDTLYLLAVCQRYLCQYADARATLARIKALAPEYARAHQEEGHLNRADGRRDAALTAYARACQQNPALEASFRARLELLTEAGRRAEAAAVAAQLDWLQKLPPPLVAVVDLMAQGRLGRAEDVCRRFMQQNPRHVEGMRLLADMGLRLGVLEDAEFLLESAVAFAPDHIPVRIDYVRALQKRQKFARALEEADRLLQMAPEQPQLRSLHAVVSLQAGRYDDAIGGFDQVLARLPNDPATLTARGHALKTCGRTREAVDSYRAASRSHPDHGEAYYALANLKTYRFTDTEIDAMRARLEHGDLGHMDRVYLHFALGKAYEDRCAYDESFRHYAAGNALKKAQSRYDAGRMHDELEAQRRLCARGLFERHAGTGHPAPDPIFIVGLPRAGSTLLEQILASHSQVDGTQELPNILSLSQRLRRRQADGPYPAVLEALPAEELAAFGREYLEETRIHRRGAPFFIDKMPNNFRHIGLIRLILPNAKVIDARRHPMACCFSGFKQLFAEGQEFSYSLADIGRYYRDYVSLMDHWDTVLPGFVLRVQHEDVVKDLDGQVRRLLDFCGLPFESACLRYYETDRSIRTPSSEQVRQPIFGEGVAQWRHYLQHLTPLEEALGPEILERYASGAR
jgi:tetratricopeptide (TPR) repeat protein